MFQLACSLCSEKPHRLTSPLMNPALDGVYLRVPVKTSDQVFCCSNETREQFDVGPYLVRRGSNEIVSVLFPSRYHPASVLLFSSIYTALISSQSFSDLFNLQMENMLIISGGNVWLKSPKVIFNSSSVVSATVLWLWVSRLCQEGLSALNKSLAWVHSLWWSLQKSSPKKQKNSISTFWFTFVLS